MAAREHHKVRQGMTRIVKCRSCGKESITISSVLGLCADCLRTDFDRWFPEVMRVHEQARAQDGLPLSVARSPDGVTCQICGNNCQLGPGEAGYCGLRIATGKRLEFVTGTARRARVSWYHDALPTNCVADWVCAGGSDCGYPQYSHSQGPEYGYYNLAVFYEACSFDCLFCQNWHYRGQSSHEHSADDVARDVTDRVSCICFFGGDPGPQVIHALATARLARSRRSGILRICWETNGNLSERYLGAIVKESLESGGTIKIDLKAWSEPISYALCGISNRRTLEVVGKLLKIASQRRDPPLVVISTLLVPGYIDESEVRSIAEFIASLDPDTPYSLLGFAPNFLMADLPCTSLDHAERCLEQATSAGLKRVHIGNRHLLGKDY